ncbi:28S ribosomal protein S15, mitochondrial [Aethina tumida]|uniref:28S ribosomal protein S15, mitochondrial n=1 Tax=Aethina tumida TaxID=116153 RepID=UPI002149356E|nr:28S ribosomal protein S15, mitochondrial [Aethina tumida]
MSTARILLKNALEANYLRVTPNVNNLISRNYAFKSDLKIKWNRPEKIPCYKPEKSGDLGVVTKIDQTGYKLEFRNSKELETADEYVKRLLTLEFAPKRETNKLYRHELMQTVKRHELDIGSIEVKIAKWTGIIRAWQETMERFPRNKKLKVQLKELIDKRKKHLKYLRRWDYKKFEWLLEKLNIVYKAPPNEYHWITRKDSLTKLTNIYCENIKNDKLNEYRYILEQEQPAFLEEKIRTLQFIRNEQRDCGVEVTVSQEEIDAVKQQLSDLVNSRKNVEE